MSSPTGSPAPSIRSPLPPEAPKESAVARLLIAPLTFLSFLLSLFLIDTRNHALRTHLRSPSPQPTTFLSRLRSFFHSLFFKRVGASPYEYVEAPSASSSGVQTGDGSGRGGVKREKQGEEWHWHTHQRKLIKSEMDDAFRLRHSVACLLLAVGALVVTGGVWVLGRCGMWVWVNGEKIGFSRSVLDRGRREI